MDTNKKNTDLLNGIVFNCKALNLRKTKSLKSEILTTMKFGEKVEIDESKSNSKWFKVFTKDGLSGYALKEFIEIK